MRKTIFVILSSHGGQSPANPVTDAELASIVDPQASRLIDYYRVLRNEQLHGTGVGATEEGPTAIFKLLDKAAIASKFDRAASPPNAIAIDDVLLCSLAWQEAAKSLCVALAHPDTVLRPLVETRFGRLGANRRQTAARNFLREAFLLDSAAIDTILWGLNWAG